MSHLSRLTALTLLAAVVLPSLASAQTSSLEFEVEAGPVWLSNNDVEIPNDGTATRFSLSDLVGGGPWPAGRLYVTWRPSADHAVRLLAAPLSVAETGILSGTVNFAGATYDPGEPVEGTYTFNSFRATYRWRFHTGNRSQAWVGITAKIRDASVILAQGTTTSRKDDFGFVPLLHLSAQRQLGQRWHVSFDADALAGGPGRAIDAALRLGYDLDDNWSIRAGYRTVEGGADVDSVYNFAWLHYGAVSIVWLP
jgi:hypothetical protein